MMLFLRTLPTLVALWLAVAFTVALRLPASFWALAAVTTLIPALALRFITRQAVLPRRFFSLTIFPGFATLGAFGTLLFSEYPTFQVLTCVSVIGVQWLFLEQAFRFTFQPARYQKNALTNLALLAAILGLFFAALVLFDLALFASFSLLFQGLIFAVLFAGWFFGVTYLIQADRQTTKLYGVVTLLVGLELYVVVSRLPVLPTVKAGLLIIVIGYALHLLRRHVEASEKRLGWSLSLFILVLLCLLVTARWFA